MLWWLLLVVSILFLYVKVWKRQQYWKEKQVAHIKPWPIFGSAIDGILQRISMGDSMLRDAQTFKGHRYYGFYQMWMPTLAILDTDLIKQISIKDFDYFTDHIIFVSDKFDPLLGNSLLMLKGQKWRNMRATLSPAFTSSKMKAMFHLMSECAAEFIDYYVKNADRTKHTTVEMKDIFTRYTNDVIASCAFGIKCNSTLDENNEFYLMGKRSTDLSGLKGLIMFGYTISQSIMECFRLKLIDQDVQDFFKNLIISTMKTREEKGILRPDMIHLLMQARKGNLKFEESKHTEDDAGFATARESQIGKENKGKVMDLSDDDVSAQALNFFFAGFDTSSTLLSHMANELAINPDIQEKLQAEVDETLKNCKDGKVTYEVLTKMKYMDMVVSETLRKWSPGGVTTRICTKPYTIQPTRPHEHPVQLEKGDLIFFPIFAVHRNPEYFPNPERFDPERFNDENKDKIKDAYIPFGVGPRNCIGSRFALLETKILMVYILSKFDFVVDEKTQIPLQLSKSNFNMTAENGFWLGLKLRR